MGKKLTVLLLLTTLALGLTACGSSYMVNRPDTQKGKPITNGMELYESTDVDFCFLYPAGEMTSYSEADGVAVYKNKTGNAPYLLIKKTDKKGMTRRSTLKHRTSRC